MIWLVFVSVLVVDACACVWFVDTADDDDVIGREASHVTAAGQVHGGGLERWNSYEEFSGLSTSFGDAPLCTSSALHDGESSRC